MWGFFTMNYPFSLILAFIGMCGLTGCFSQLSNIPNVPTLDSLEIPDVNKDLVPETTLPKIPAIPDIKVPNELLSTQNISCVAGFVENKPGYGTLDIYTSPRNVNEVTHIEDVSIETAKEITEDMGEC